MVIKTKYSIGDTVWCVDGINGIKTGTVVSIDVECEPKRYKDLHISYVIGGNVTYTRACEHLVFNKKEDASKEYSKIYNK